MQRILQQNTRAGLAANAADLQPDERAIAAARISATCNLARARSPKTAMASLLRSSASIRIVRKRQHAIVAKLPWIL